jgi:outer membrane protein TolC
MTRAFLILLCLMPATIAGPAQGQDPVLGHEVPQLPVLGAFSDAKVTELLAKMKSSDKLKSLLKARLDAAKITADARAKEFIAGRGTLDFLLGASRHLLKSELELSDSKADQISAYESHLKLLKMIRDTNKGRFDAGRIPLQDWKESEYDLLDTEIALERLRCK